MLEVELYENIPDYGLVRVRALCISINDTECEGLHFYFLDRDEDEVLFDIPYSKELFDDLVETATEALTEMYYNKDVYSKITEQTRH